MTNQYKIHNQRKLSGKKDVTLANLKRKICSSVGFIRQRRRATVKKNIKSYVRDTKSYVRDTKSYVRDTNSYVRDTKSHLRDTKSYVRDTNSYVRLSKSYVRDTKSYVRYTKSYVRDTKSYVRDTKSYVRLINSYVRDTKSYVRLTYSGAGKLKELPRVNRAQDPVEDQKSQLLSFSEILHLNFAVFLSKLIKKYILLIFFSIL